MGVIIIPPALLAYRTQWLLPKLSSLVGEHQTGLRERADEQGEPFPRAANLPGRA